MRINHSKLTIFSTSASLALHVVFFLFLIIHFKALDKTLIPGKNENVIQSYLYVHEKKDVANKKLAVEKIPKNSLDPVFTQSHEAVSKTQKQALKPSQSNKIATQKFIDGEHEDALLRLLHEAIQNQQQYPPNALQMGREGRVIVGFTLFGNGTIADLKLIQPCQTQSLNQAALKAVEAATPFKNIDNYLQSPKVFSIEIAFELPSRGE